MLIIKDKYLYIHILPLLMLLISCGRASNSEEADTVKTLSPREKEMVNIVSVQLPRGEKLEDFRIVECKIPIELYAKKFKTERDSLLKAGLDFNSSKTRGLTEGEEKAKIIIDNIQKNIIERVKKYDAAASGECLFLLGTVSQMKSMGSRYLLIAGYNPNTMQRKFWEQVTLALQNNAQMIVNALEGNLFDYAIETIHEPEDLADDVSNPVVKFILEADRTLVR